MKKPKTNPEVAINVRVCGKVMALSLTEAELLWLELSRIFGTTQSDPGCCPVVPNLTPAPGQPFRHGEPKFWCGTKQ